MTDAAARPAAVSRGRRTRLWLGVAVAALVALFAGVTAVQWRQYALLNGALKYESDNIVWSFFQFEVEYFRLRDAALSYAAGRPEVDFDTLQQRYEVFASRLPLVEPGRTEAFLPSEPVQTGTLAGVRALLAWADPLVGADRAEATPPAPATIAPLIERLETLREPIHDMSLWANHAMSLHFGSRNDLARQQTQLVIGLTALQCVLTLVLAVMAMRQLGLLEKRSSRLTELATRVQEARDEAEAASRAKSAFLANMSHELRTPFNGMLGMLSVLERTPLSTEQAEHLRTATESARHLLTLLDDILDISKLESGRLSIVPVDTSLHRLLRGTEQLMRPAAESKGLAFEVGIDDGVPDWVHVDDTRLKQVLFNLLSNAIKFSPQGRVRLLVRAHGGSALAAPGELRQVEFRVEDTGIGMDSETLGRLFRRFSQGDDSTQRRFGGTGLGLEISRTLARMMDGDITVTSEPGWGSCFTLALPLRSVAPPAEAEPPAAEATQLRPADVPGLDVLVAEDHDVNRRVMQLMLEAMGHRVRFAADGAAAVRAVQAGVPDLVLMDMHMPVLDGLQATQALRALPAPAGAVRIVALTADAFRESRERALAAGMDGFLCKPVRPDELAAALVQGFGARGAPCVPARPSSSAGTSAPASPPVQPAAASPAPAAPPRPKPMVPPPEPGELAGLLDTELIGEMCLTFGRARYAKLLANGLADRTGTLAALMAAVDTGDAAAMRERAHALVGAAGTLGLRRVAEVARQIEHAVTALDEPGRRAAREALAAAWRRSTQFCERLDLLPDGDTLVLPAALDAPAATRTEAPPTEPAELPVA